MSACWTARDWRSGPASAIAYSRASTSGCCGSRAGSPRRRRISQANAGAWRVYASVQNFRPRAPSLSRRCTAARKGSARGSMTGPATRRRFVMSLGTILLIVLILILIGVIPTWPHSRSWGYAPSGVLGVVLIVVVVLLLTGRL